MTINKQTEFFDKVDVSVSLAKLIYSYLEKRYPCKTIAEIADTTSGGTPLRGHSDYYGGNIPWIKSGELNDGIITQYEETITEKGLKNSSAKIYKKGTLVIALYGATAGKTGIVDFDTASNQAVAAIYPKKEVERDYMFWFFRQKRFDYIQMSFGAAQPNISQTVVKATKIPVPKKNIQQEVVEFLDAIESSRELKWKNSLEPIWIKIKGFYNLYQTREGLLKELDQQQTYLQLLHQSILQEAVQGKLTKQDITDEPTTELLKRIKAEKQKLIKAGKRKKEKELPPITENEIPFELPKGWVCCRLEEIARVGTGSTPLTTNKEYYQGDIPWITSSATGNLFVLDTEKNISEKALKETNCRVYPVGTLIIAMYGQGKTRGQITELLIDAATNQACAAIELIVKNENHKKYIKYFFQKIYLEIRELAEGGAQPNLNLQKIKDTFIPLPPLAEQQRIVAKVQKLQQELSQLEAQVQQSRQYAQQLLQSVLKEAFEEKGKVYEMEEERVWMVAEE
jgi:type I restriction enzyme, S subunit